MGAIWRKCRVADLYRRSKSCRWPTNATGTLRVEGKTPLGKRWSPKSAGLRPGRARLRALQPLGQYASCWRRSIEGIRVNGFRNRDLRHCCTARAARFPARGRGASPGRSDAEAPPAARRPRPSFTKWLRLIFVNSATRDGKVIASRTAARQAASGQADRRPHKNLRRFVRIQR